MRFDTYGPFELPRDGALIASGNAQKKAFWSAVDESIAGLADACGCYVFYIGATPWYVGKAEKQSFRKEVLSDHKLKHFNSSLAAQSGKPKLLLIAQNKSGNFSSPLKSGRPAIAVLEQLLIGQAISKNGALCNLKGTKALRELVVPGFLNTPRGTANAKPVQAFKKVMGLK